MTRILSQTTAGNRRHKLIAGYITGISLLLAACGQSPKEIQNTDRREVLDTLAHRVIVAAFETFEQQADSLRAAAAGFAAQPGKQSLETVRNKWKDATFAWKRASAYTFGPVEDQFLIGGIDYISVHYPNIEKSIATDAVIDEAYITTRGSSLKGLKAIEYLLFKTAAPDEVISEFAGSKQRADYLSALAVSLHTQAKKALNAWAGGNTPYVQSFVSADGRDLKSSMGILVNKCVHQVNFVMDEKIGAPMGMRNEGVPQPDLVEGWLSGTSLELLKNEIVSVQKCFERPSGKSIGALLDQLEARREGKLLSEALSEQFNEVYQCADRISVPLEQAIVQDRESVLPLYNAIKKLQVMLEVDVVNHLGIVLTFSDNDGD